MTKTKHAVVAVVNALKRLSYADSRDTNGEKISF
jgi:hypothetical protein